MKIKKYLIEKVRIEAKDEKEYFKAQEWINKHGYIHDHTNYSKTPTGFIVFASKVILE